MQNKHQAGSHSTKQDQHRSPFKGRVGLGRLLHAFGYSLDGLQAGWRHEPAFRQITIIACLGIPLALIFDMPGWARSIVILSHFLCLMVELVNSAIEAAVDHTSLEVHVLAKRAKDLGSAAQLICMLNLLVAWALATTA
ncbi:diacylglycerol kinase [Chitinolyticbacter meiyuanensis]|uniref:diacylglycerol kinase n=1 Tax=Chitinolyticbacter meiyuanensis TaxID=682798 RepID=UPI0011E5E6D0|nr:diacylglycerol kinase [Chitinolyticbacter meiyuanensis]